MSLAIVELLFASGAGSLDAWRSILDERVHIRIGSRAPVLGMAAALDELDEFLANVRSFGGRYREVWELKEATLVETEIVCRKTAHVPRMAVPCALFFRTTGVLAQDIRFYLDPTPLFRGRADGGGLSHANETKQ